MSDFLDCKVVDGPLAGATIRVAVTGGVPPETMTLAGYSYARQSAELGGFEYRAA